MTFTVGVGQSATFLEGEVSSKKFRDCALFLLRNETTKQILLMHCFPGDEGENEPVFSQQGLSSQQANMLKTFIDTPGIKTGYALRQPPKGHPAYNTQYVDQIASLLEKNHINMLVQTISIPENASARALARLHFDIAYSTQDNKLKINVTASAEEEEGISEEWHQSNYEVKPFAHARIRAKNSAEATFRG